jgi:Uma2 family endonuclease
MATQLVTLSRELDALRDDDEETLVGSSLHQGAIVALYTGLVLCGPRRGLPCFVGNQLKLVIPRGGNRAPYQPAPDILVHPTLGASWRSSLLLAVDGPPALIIEVASPSTATERDVHLTAPDGKPRAYEAAGVAEYLVFDPAGDILGAQVWACRAGSRGYEPWEPDAAGRWSSAALGISFEPQGVLLRVYDQAGRLVPTIDERDAAATELDRRIVELDPVAAEQDRRIAELEAEVRRLRGE